MLEQYEYTAPAARRVSYSRQPSSLSSDTPGPLTVATLCGIAATVGAAAVVMLIPLQARWLWIAALLGAAAFLAALIWRLQVLDTLSVIERETTITGTEQAVRPVIHDRAVGNVIRRGNFQMSREQWMRLYELARNGRPLTRDAARDADAMPRDLYIEWASTMAEMRRIGLIDDEHRMTDAWRDFHRSIVENTTPPAARPPASVINPTDAWRGRGVE
ncbi:MAG: hypothetical protein IPM49_18520 [Flavobacteriales bacterium]|nr:hypothetical protein [Flavobacteriales bacterium]